MKGMYTSGGDDVFGQTSPPPQKAEFFPFLEESDASASDDDDNLAWRIAQYRDEDAANKLYDRYSRGIYRFLLVKTSNVAEAQELTAETFLRMVEGFRNGTWMGQPFRLWLYGTARNVYFEWLRGIRRRFALADRIGSQLTVQGEHIDAEEVLEEAIERERGATLWRLVAELPEKDRQVLVLRFMYDLSHEETAMHIGCTPEACKTRQNRALRKLRDKIRQAGLGEDCIRKH